MQKIKSYASLVKFSHTVFALPFAIVGYFLALQQTNSTFLWSTLVAIVLCMFFARNAAMSFNRYIDRRFDAANPRTASREIPQGIILEKHALLFCIANAALFIITTAFINKLCLALSPVALFVILGYSLTKRFTALCHFILGLGLSLAPIGAYIAVAGQFAFTPLLFSLVVLLWTSGFDIIYALPDEEFDRENHLFSVPSMLGRKGALRLSSIIHIICMLVALYISTFVVDNLYFRIGTAIFICCLFYQHSIVSAKDISRVNIAFATVNGIASIVFAIFCVLSFTL